VTRPAITIALLVALAALHVTVLQRTTVEHGQLPRGAETAFVPPSLLLKITSLEFQGLAADVLFLDAVIFYGGKIIGKLHPDMALWEWRWLEKTLTAATDLDPYFYDPYYFGNAVFSWEAGMVTEANVLLEKGSGHRYWDWTLPFFIGFNKFYFLQENEKAAAYLMEASRRPNASPLLASMASKLVFKENKTETSIQFLEEMLQRTDDELTKQRFKKRIDALRGILLLEQAVAQYEKRFHVKPRSVELLSAKGIIQKVPQDPYGGKFYLDQAGSVKSTTERELMPHRK